MYQESKRTHTAIVLLIKPFVQRRCLCRCHHGFLRPRLHGSGQIFAQTKTCMVPPCVYKGPAELDDFFVRLSVQVWDLKKAGQRFDRHGSIFVRTRVNTRTVQLFAQIARLQPEIIWRDWSKLCTDPCKHHCNRICTDPCKQAVQEQNSSLQKFVRTRVNGALNSLFCLCRGPQRNVQRFITHGHSHCSVHYTFCSLMSFVILHGKKDCDQLTIIHTETLTTLIKRAKKL